MPHTHHRRRCLSYQYQRGKKKTRKKQQQETLCTRKRLRTCFVLRLCVSLKKLYRQRKYLQQLSKTVSYSTNSYRKRKKKEKRASRNRGRVNENCVAVYVDTKTDVYVHVFSVCCVPASVAPLCLNHDQNKEAVWEKCDSSRLVETFEQLW